MAKKMHLQRLAELAVAAADLAENRNEDGTVNWNFVSADLHIDTQEDTDRIEKALGIADDAMKRRAQKPDNAAEVRRILRSW